ncbi:hypothetical protein LCGC14_1845400, partial [marine sediment metagenome]
RVMRGAYNATILNCNGDRTAINLTNAKSWVFENFKIDADDLGIPTFAIKVNEVNDNKVIIENVNVFGVGAVGPAGSGIQIQSNYCEVKSCIIDQLNTGISVSGSDCIISHNITSNCLYGLSNTGTRNLFSNNEPFGNNVGILITTNGDCSIIDNFIYNCVGGIYLQNGTDRNFINNNYIHTMSSDGIHIDAGCNDNKIGINYYYNITGDDVDDSGTGTIRYYTQAEVDALLHAQAHTLASHSTKAHNELSDAPADAHHVKYTNPNAVDAIEAVGIAAPISTDWLIFSDNGVLKKVAMSTLTPTIMTGLPKYTDAQVQALSINSVLEDASPQLGGPLDANGNFIADLTGLKLKVNANAAIYIYLASSDHKYNGTLLNITTNGGSFGIPMYSDTTGRRVSVCVDTSINTMPCIGIWAQANYILTEGYIRDSTWNFTIGKPVYVNGSVFSTTIPPAVGDIVQVVGVSISTDEMYFKPSLDWVVRK